MLYKCCFLLATSALELIRTVGLQIRTLRQFCSFQTDYNSPHGVWRRMLHGHLGLCADVGWRQERVGKRGSGCFLGLVCGLERHLRDVAIDCCARASSALRVFVMRIAAVGQRSNLGWSEV